MAVGDIVGYLDETAQPTADALATGSRAERSTRGRGDRNRRRQRQSQGHARSQWHTMAASRRR